MTVTLDGQWIGLFTGTNTGNVIIDIDDFGDHYEGHALAFDDDKELPGILIGLRTSDKSSEQHLQSVRVEPMHPTQPLVLDVATVRSTGIQFPDKVEVHLKMTDGNLAAEWKSDAGTIGKAQLNRRDADSPSAVPVEKIDGWHDFVRYMLDLEPNRYIFRGQPEPKRLRTTFHRTRRKDLVRFVRDDLLRAHHTVSGQTRHFFVLGDPLQNTAFLSLLQHHGFPTPLLDWTHSPFVAAFFAYRRGQGRDPQQDKVRILVFDAAAWVRDYQQIQSIAFAGPHFSVIEAYNFENRRAGPQQSISTVSNVDDIETYVATCEQARASTYLRAIDLPFTERRDVMEKLRIMGITAASLFPGLDGTCEELRGRFFHPL